MNYVRVENGVVTEVLKPVEGFTCEECFPKDVLDSCVKTEQSAQIGWKLNSDNVFEAPGNEDSQGVTTEGVPFDPNSIIKPTEEELAAFNAANPT